MKKLVAADLFCGAGGTSTGLIEACESLGYDVELTAINHWKVAVATHTANHPKARHLCASLDSLNPRDLYGEGKLDILWASPECTHHSIARGGKPVKDQSRATAWCVVRWAEALRPNIILVENVKEFMSWGPLIRVRQKIKGRSRLVWIPDPKRKGEIFMSWVRNLEAIGYRVDWRVLCAADYGDPTERRRLFVQAVRGKRRIVWPEPTHAPSEETDLFNATRKPWASAEDHVIDWSLSGKSIYGRKKPLAPNTLNRIWHGLEMVGLSPFIIGAGGPQGSAQPNSVKRPLRTVLKENHFHLVQPFLAKLRGTSTIAKCENPLPTITAGGNHLALVEPFLIEVNHGNGADKKGDVRRVRSIKKPLSIVTGSRGTGIVQPFILSIDHTGGNCKCVSPANSPLTTITTKQRHALVQPYLVNYYGTGHAIPVSQPLPTVTTKERFGLVQPILEIKGEKYRLEILFRMLNWKELAAGQGFRSDYQFTGSSREICAQIGNAVPRNLAAALVRSAVTQQP